VRPLDRLRSIKVKLGVVIVATVAGTVCVLAAGFRLGWSEKGVFMSDKLNLIQTLEKTDMFSIFTRLLASSGTNDILSAP